MANSLTPEKHREVKPRDRRHGPSDLPSGGRKPARRSRRKSSNRGTKKPSNAGPRYRAQDQPAVNSHLGSQQLISDTGSLIRSIDEDHLLYPRIDRMWDESHKLERPVLFRYRPNIYSRLRRVYGKPVHNSGGPLHHIKCFQSLDEIQGIGEYYGRDFRPYGGFLSQYVGGFVPANWNHGYSIVDFNNAGFVSPIDLDFGSATPYGAQAYNKMKPRVADFDAMQGLGQNLVELPQQLRTTSEGLANAYQAITGRSARGIGRDSLRKVLGGRASRKDALKDLLMPDKIGEQFLNEQFGWLPFISDMKDLYRAYRNQSTNFDNIRRQNGTWNHRRRTLFNTEEQSPITTLDNYAGNCYPVLTDDFYRNSGTWVTSHLSTLTQRKVWASGSFKFYAPEFDSSNRASEGMYGDVMRLVHYYGVRVSPTVIWELTPWTWLGDWFTNAGNVIDNVTSSIFDRLVSKYAYAMCTTNVFAFNQTAIHLKAGDVACNWIQHVLVQDRKQAHPYGFGLTDGDLSVRQSLILAAIGITRR